MQLQIIGNVKKAKSIYSCTMLPYSWRQKEKERKATIQEKPVKSLCLLCQCVCTCLNCTQITKMHAATE